jgi:hypothetical protein
MRSRTGRAKGRRSGLAARLAPVLALAGCSFEGATPAAVQQPAVIGQRDFVPVPADLSGLSEALLPVARATGVLSTPCTITHLGDGVAVTAAHCIALRHLEDCSPLRATWDDPALAQASVPCAAVLQHEFTSDTDVALLQFAQYPQAALALDTTFQGRDRLAGRELTMLSHPGGRELMSSGQCTPLRIAEDEHAGQFAHSCDATSGSSGAAVVDVATLRVVGIHSSGVTGTRGSYNLATFARAVDAPR